MANTAVTFAVTTTDGVNSTTQTVTYTIIANNDAPTAVSDTAAAVEAGGTSNGTAGSNPTGNVLSNDTDVDAGDTKTVTGVAAGALLSTTGSVGASVTGSYGSITINSDGTYSYAVDNNNTTVQALTASSNALDDVFTYTIIDAGGLESSTQFTITIQGANDTATLDLDTSTAGVNFTSSFTENGPADAITNSNAALNDIGESDLTSLRITVTGNLDGANERLFIGGETIALNGDASLTNISIGSTSVDIAYTAASGEVAISRTGSSGICRLPNFNQ